MEFMIKTLQSLLATQQFCGPVAADMSIIKLSMQFKFEPHGAASETWEEVWIAEFPFHNLRTTGRTPAQAIDRAISYFQMYGVKEPKIPVRTCVWDGNNDGSFDSKCGLHVTAEHATVMSGYPYCPCGKLIERVGGPVEDANG